jgi:hypothetical protein
MLNYKILGCALLLSSGVATVWAQEAVSPTTTTSETEAKLPDTLTQGFANVNAAIANAATVSETASLCRDKEGFTVPCSIVEMVNQANGGYKAGMADALAGKPMGSGPEGSAPGSYARGYSEGLAIKTGNPNYANDEQTERTQKTLDDMDPSKRPAFRATFRGMIQYQNSINQAQEAGYGADEGTPGSSKIVDPNGAKPQGGASTPSGSASGMRI